MINLGSDGGVGETAWDMQNIFSSVCLEEHDGYATVYDIYTEKWLWLFPICVMHIHDQHSNVPRPDDSLDHQTEHSLSKPVGLTVGLLQVMNSYEGRS